MKTSKKRIQWGALLVLAVLLSQLWIEAMILYRIRNIDAPKEVHFMLPQMNSSAVEISR